MRIIREHSKIWYLIFGFLLLIIGVLTIFVLIFRNFDLVKLVTSVLFIIIGLIFIFRKKEPLDIGKETKKMDKQDATMENALKGKNLK